MEARAAAGMGRAQDFGILPKRTVEFYIRALTAQLAGEGAQQE